MNEPRVVIVGGGVIGLSIAYALAREGTRSTVLDRRELGREASWAGAGIIAPGAERPTTDPAAALRTLSARLHADWAESLCEETGLDTGYRRCGGLDVAWSRAEEAELDAAAEQWRAEGIACERLNGPALREIEPALNPAIASAWFLPGRSQLRNPRHLRALTLACERRGVALRPGVAAEGFEVAADRVAAVRTAEGPLPCDQLIVAAGAWSGGLLEGLGLDVPTPPVKGQIVLLRCGRPVLRRVVEWGRNYLVPRDDGRVLAGATEEDAGFDTRPTPLAVRDLIDLALRLCPALTEAEVEKTWAGLRPGSADGGPLIGPAPGLANVLIATGHRRAGLQLSTGTASIVTDLLLGREPPLDIAPFRPDRRPTPSEGEVFRS
jgi:glycine oxidase